MRCRGMKALAVIAVLLVAVCFVPVGAHLLELPGKMAMDRDAYFTTQLVYNGWAMFGIAEVAAIIAALAFAWVTRDQPIARGLAFASAGLIVASLVAFFALTFPGNVATGNWTVAPDNWEALRFNWEIGHATGAVLTFLSLVAITISAVAAKI
jgi:hypothetical protein